DGSPVAYARLGWCWQGLDFNREQRRASRASRTAPKVTGRAMASCTSPSTRAKAILGPRFGDEEAGFRFGQLGLDLVEKPGLGRFKARVSLHFAYFVIPRSRHFRTGLNLLRRSLSAAQEAGDVKCIGYCRDRLVTFLLVLGNPLEEVQREAEDGLRFAQQAK